MQPLHAASLAFWLVPCLSPAIAQVVVKLDSPGPTTPRTQSPSPSQVLRVADATVQRQVGTKDFPAAGPAIDLGVTWLLAHEDEDGRWSAERFMAHDKGAGGVTDGPGNAANDVGTTGLAVLALAREGPPGAGTARHRAIERGASWLVEQQDDKEKGLIGAKAAQGFVYSHAIATFALCAASTANGDAAHKAAAQKAVAYLGHHRNPFGVWRYQPREPDGDSSITTWAVLALRAGGELGLQVDPAALKTAAVFFDAVTDDKGRVGYTKAGEGSSRPVGKQGRFPPERAETLTAAGLMCRQALGQSIDAMPAVAALGKDRLLEKPPEWTPNVGNIDHCYWFFGTEAMRGASAGARSDWGKKLVEALVKGQRVDGASAGSWDPVDAWGEDGGRIYATAMSVLALQALYGGAAAPAPEKPAGK